MPSYELLAEVAFPPTTRERVLAVLRVRLEDVSLADAPATVVAATEVRDVLVPADGTVVEVPIPVPAGGDPSRRLSLRAHGSVTGADTFQSDDFLSTSSAPVELGLTPSVDVAVELLS